MKFACYGYQIGNRIQLNIEYSGSSVRPDSFKYFLVKFFYQLAFSCKPIFYTASIFNSVPNIKRLFFCQFPRFLGFTDLLNHLILPARSLNK